MELGEQTLEKYLSPDVKMLIVAFALSQSLALSSNATFGVEAGLISKSEFFYAFVYLP